MQRLSIRAYAKKHRVNRRAVQDAIARGTIVLDADGLIAPAQPWERLHRDRLAEQAAGAEAAERDSRARLTRTVAKVVQMRRKVEQTQQRLADRDAAEREISEIVAALPALLADERRKTADPAARAALDAIEADLGDLMAEALRVTRL